MSRLPANYNDPPHTPFERLSQHQRRELVDDLYNRHGKCVAGDYMIEGVHLDLAFSMDVPLDDYYDNQVTTRDWRNLERIADFVIERTTVSMEQAVHRSRANADEELAAIILKHMPATV